MDPTGEASILSRVIKDSDTDKTYRFAHKWGKITDWNFIKHSLVDRDNLDSTSEVSHYTGKKYGVQSTEDSYGNEYEILYTDMDDTIISEAIVNVKNAKPDRFTGENYNAVFNNCNRYTRAIFKEYKKLWKENFKTTDAYLSGEKSVYSAWRDHLKEITARRGEKVTIGGTDGITVDN